jgi:hypothetical protein
MHVSCVTFREGAQLRQRLLHVARKVPLRQLLPEALDAVPAQILYNVVAHGAFWRRLASRCCRLGTRLRWLVWLCSDKAAWIH